MIITNNEREISRSDDIRDSGFKVQATGKAFKILSSSLYRNKIQAIVRELSTNAVDAQIAAGCGDVPFEVHLPNALEPYFSVRDFGNGLSEQDVYEVYTTYFHSTKTSSNDFTGALGLGSKSPFSYCDSYTVISRHAGIKNAYALYMNEQDCPVVSRMGEGVALAQGEGTGLEVKMSVRSPDMSNFVNEARSIYSRFAVLPKIIGCAGFETVQRKYMFDGGFYRVLDGSDRSKRYGETGHNLIMGNIAYPVNLENFANRAAAGSLLSKHALVLRDVSLEIIAPIGSVDFTAGREDLSYDQRVTIPYLLTAYENMLSHFISYLSSRFVAVKNEFEARLLYANSFHDPVFRLARGSVVWQGTPITSSRMLLSNLPEDIDIRRSQSLTVSAITPAVDSQGRVNPNGRSISIEASNDLVFYVNDLRRNGVKILRSYFYNSRGTDNNKYTSYYVVGEGKNSQTTIDALLANFPGVKIVPISSLPVPSVKQPPARKPTRVKRLTGRGKSSGVIVGLPEVDVDLDDGGIYVLSEFTNLKTDTTRLKRHASMATYVSHMVDLIGDADPVYVVPVSISSRIEKHPAWIRLEDVAREQLEQQLKLHDLPSLQVAHATNTERSKYNELLAFYKAYGAKLDQSKNFVCAFAQMFDKIVELKDQARTIIPLTNAFDIAQTSKGPFPVGGQDLQLEKSFNRIMQQYPMLNLVEDYNLKDQRVFDYMQQCDSNSKGDAA